MALLRHPYHSLGDEELMKLVVERNQRSFEILYDRYAKLMYNYFLRMLWKDREKARDFTQDLFAKLVHKPHLFDPARPFKTWLYSIAHNMCKNEYGKMQVRKNVHAEMKYVQGSDHEQLSANKIDRDQFNRKLEEALQELDEVKRTTFELRFRQELSIQEISEVMECNEGTVKSRLFYTLKQLNGKLKVFEGISLVISAFHILIS